MYMLPNSLFLLHVQICFHLRAAEQWPHPYCVGRTLSSHPRAGLLCQNWPPPSLPPFTPAFQRLNGKWYQNDLRFTMRCKLQFHRLSAQPVGFWDSGPRSPGQNSGQATLGGPHVKFQEQKLQKKVSLLQLLLIAELQTNDSSSSPGSTNFLSGLGQQILLHLFWLLFFFFGWKWYYSFFTGSAGLCLCAAALSCVCFRNRSGLTAYRQWLTDITTLSQTRDFFKSTWFAPASVNRRANLYSYSKEIGLNLLYRANIPTHSILIPDRYTVTKIAAYNMPFQALDI